jgi:hypothetical protein
MRCRLVASVVLILAAPCAAQACSIAASGRFAFAPGAPTHQAAGEGPKVVSAAFIPSMSGGTSCDGVGSLTIELELPHSPQFRKGSHGFFVRGVSGVHDSDLLPRHPVAPVAINGTIAKVVLGWVWATPDPDGHHRWVLEISSASRSGEISQATSLCVASDASCHEEQSGAAF